MTQDQRGMIATASVDCYEQIRQSILVERGLRGFQPIIYFEMLKLADRLLAKKKSRRRKHAAS